jgi:hypothetical protein
MLNSIRLRRLRLFDGADGLWVPAFAGMTFLGCGP